MLLASPTGSAAVSTAPKLLWGAKIGTQFTGKAPPLDMSGVADLARIVGKAPSLIGFGSTFENCSSSPCSSYGFPTGAMSAIRTAGAIPFFSWSSEAAQAPAHNSSFRLSSLTSGRYDTYIRSFALAAKQWGHPFFLRFDWEMNGDWYPWAEDVNGNRKGQFVAAWRHVHDIFTSAGATNATWVWCPNTDPANTWLRRSGSRLSEYYPGDKYVDWTCLDGFNFGTNRSHPYGWETFDRVYRSAYSEVVKIAPSKPMIAGEVASSEDGGSKAGWISRMFSELPSSYPQIRAVVWYEAFESGMDWPVETSRSAQGAFAHAIRGSAYVGNAYANLAGGGAIVEPGLSIKAVLARQAAARRRHR